MTILEIKPIDKRRMRIETDEDFAFALYNREVYRFSIEEGGELSDEVYHLEIVPILKKRIRERTVFILERRDRTSQELFSMLERGLYPQELIEDVISWAKRYRYIDDERYLGFYLDAYEKKKSRMRLIFDLKKKGFTEEQILEALDAREIDEDEQIRKLLEKKGLEKLQDEAMRQKIFMQIARKGYTFDRIARCIEEYRKNIEEY